MLCYCYLVFTSHRTVWRYCRLDDADDIFRASAQLTSLETLRSVDVGLANPITEVTDVGESNVRVVIASAFFLWADAHYAAKIPNAVLLEAQAATAVPVTDTRAVQVAGAELVGREESSKIYRNRGQTLIVRHERHVNFL